MIRLAEPALIERDEAQRRREHRQHAREREPRIRPAVGENNRCAPRVTRFGVVDAQTGTELSVVEPHWRACGSLFHSARCRRVAPFWCSIGAMPNLTLKDVPPALHARLRARAEQHHRSLNREAIACLEAAVLAERVDVKELLAKAAARRRVRSGFSSSTIRRLIRTGRP